MKTYQLEYLQTKSDKMFEYLRLPVPPIQDETKTVEHLMNLGRMLAESGEYKAAAQYQVDSIVHGEIAKAIDTALGDKVSASMANAYVKSAAKDWNYLVNSFDRINSAAGKMIMALQTLISYEKAKMNIL